MTEKKAVFFCSASYTIDPKYNQAAREAVRAACLSGYTAVSGGTVKGTMGEIADEVADCGGYHIGVIPRFMQDLLHPRLNEIVWTETMAERKMKMRQDVDLAVALPGGIGTMDELIETLVLAKLGFFKGRIVAFGPYGFYEPFRALLDHYVNTNMMSPTDRDRVIFVETIDEFKKILCQ